MNSLNLACLARPRKNLPLLVAPAMNYTAECGAPASATQQSLARHKADGSIALGPRAEG